jgi:Fe-S oxidoreductase
MLPKYSNKKFSRWYKEKSIDSKQTEKQVVFFTDTFTEFHKAEAGKKAIQVLEHLGYSPILVKKQVCCGRSAYSKGFLDRAKKLAVKNIQVLLTYAKKGIPIVGVEPSCLAMFVNEYLSLVPGEDTNLVASHVKMIEEFLFEEISSNQLQIKFDGKSRNVIYHGHCQQKANFGTEKTIEFLKLIPNISLKLADSGCCGMAGSFGYEEEHFEISTKIGEKSLVQLIDFSGENQIISASGTSCRDQIDFLTDKSSIHPIEIFADALDLKAK